MKVTYREIYDNVSALEILGKEKTPWKVGYAVGKNLLILRPEWQLVEQARADIAREFIDTKENGDEYITDQTAFNAAYKEFFERELEFEPYALPLGEVEKLKEVRGGAITALLVLGIVEGE